MHAGHVPHVMIDTVIVRGLIKMAKGLHSIPSKIFINANVEMRVKKLTVHYLPVRVAGLGGSQDVSRLQLAAEHVIHLAHRHAPVEADL